jgi:uncharacterized protein (TIGR02594 family)
MNAIARPDTNAAILAVAGSYLGLEEWPGARHNPEIMAMFGAVGHDWVKDDETPWCAAFVGAVLAQLGLPHTGKLNARSYLEWGVPVPIAEGGPGDVYVFWRGSPDAATGHVAIGVRRDGDRVLVRGGNQGNAVTDAWYPVSRILGVRRYSAELARLGRPTLREGISGAAVRDLQEELRRLGHFAGRIDGIFGPRTLAAVLAFQAQEGVATDGIVGPVTWRRMADAEPMPERNIDVDELRASGSRTIKDADLTEVVATGTAFVAVAREAAGVLEEGRGVLGTITALVTEQWPALIAIAVALGLVLYLTGRIKAARVSDARSGANLGR